MDKKEFENWTNDMLKDFIKIVESGVEEFKKELGIDNEDDEYAEESGNTSGDKDGEYKNPSVEVGDWIVFENVHAGVEFTEGKPYQVKQGEDGAELDGERGRPWTVSSNGVRLSRYRFATEHEIMFAEAGRDVYEYRVGDIIYGSQLMTVVAVNEDSILASESIIDGGFYDVEVHKTNPYVKIVCLVSDRKDLQRSRP